MFGCKHRYQEVGRTFNAPVADELPGFNGRGGAAIQRTLDFYRELAYGITVVELRCQDCGDTQFRQTVGEAK